MAEKLPRAPTQAELCAHEPEIHIVPEGASIARIYFMGGKHPGSWNKFRSHGPTLSRFDHHLPNRNGEPFEQDRKILYGSPEGQANPLTTCLAEIFQATRTIDTKGGKPWFTVFSITRNLRLLDLGSMWVTKVGGNAALCSGEREMSRLWSREFYEAFPQIDGVFFPSSVAVGSPALSLYERAQDAMPSHPGFNRALCDPALNTTLSLSAQELGFALI